MLGLQEIEPDTVYDWEDIAMRTPLHLVEVDSSPNLKGTTETLEDYLRSGKQITVCRTGPKPATLDARPRLK